MKTTDNRYYAVPDPDRPDQMTYWCVGPRRTGPWPARAQYGPHGGLGEWPKDREERQVLMREWANWLERVRVAIAADPIAAGRRFAQFAIRCCLCGRTLTDPLSKCYGIGPDCRAGLSAELLARYFTPEVGRVHAAELERAAEREGEG